jgi:hypothetical protein
MSRLDRIFVRAKNSDGKWDSVSLADLTDDQFNEWMAGYMLSRLAGTPYRTDRETAVEALDRLGITPVELREDPDEI